MTKRNNIILGSNCPAWRYYKHIADDVRASMRAAAVERGDRLGVIPDADVIRWIVSDYALCKYGPVERDRVRRPYHAEIMQEIDAVNEALHIKYD